MQATARTVSHDFTVVGDLADSRGMPSSLHARFAAPLPLNEARRQRSVDALAIVDTPREPDFDDVVQLAAALCETPLAAFTVLTHDRQWFKATCGIDDTETHRDVAFCGWTILGRGPMVVTDSWNDERFREHPSVVGGFMVRFYAGIPIAAPDGEAVGSLCVFDRVPRGLSPLQLRSLQVLAHQIENQLALRSSLQAQQALAHRREELAQFIVHDLKSPLSAIAPNARFIVENAGAPVVAEAANEIELAADRMLRMVLDVLDVSRSAGELPLLRTQLDVQALLQSLATQTAARAQQAGMQFALADGPPLLAWVDRALLLRMVDNLVDNAIKYGRRQIVVSARSVAEQLVLVVADDGPGIPAAERQRIFASGQRLATHAEPAATSRGLGLCFCAMAASAHGGTIVVEDNSPVGSRFVVTLPLR